MVAVSQEDLDGSSSCLRLPPSDIEHVGPEWEKMRRRLMNNCSLTEHAQKGIL